MTSDFFFKRIQKQYDGKLPLVVYRKPNKDTIDVLLQNDATLFTTKSFEESGFVFSPFDDAEDTVLIPLNRAEHIFIRDEADAFVKPETFSEKEKNIDEDKLKHTDLVKKGIQAIADGHLQKVVLSRQEITDINEQNPVSLFRKLLHAYESAFVYCWYHPKVGLWLGATPETLVKIEGNRFSMMALAGTQLYNGTLDVTWQDKEIKEQQFVTDFIIEQIKGTVENIKVSKTETVRAGHVLHLKTLIQGALNFKKVNLETLIRDLHPTPAVCGLPKNEAKAFILANESYNREFYTGFLGELNFDTKVAPRSGKRNIENRAYAITRKRTQLYVNLRCMQLLDNQGVIYIGGGITKTSNPESEWEETVSKSLVIKNVLK